MTEKDCPICQKNKNWRDFPIMQLCEGHKKRLFRILSGDTSKNISEKVTKEELK